MADLRKEQERDELHRAIWAIADELRGSVDGWDFKSYVLGMMFYRYISENLTNYINEGEIEAGNEGFDYALLSDEEAEQAREDLVKTKGFFILPSELFCNIRKKAESDENLNMTLETVFNHIVDEFASRNDVAHFARCVPYDEIKGQDYNLSVSSYVEQEDTREVIDIAKLNAELEEIVVREQVLRDEIAKIIAELEG